MRVHEKRESGWCSVRSKQCELASEICKSIKIKTPCSPHFRFTPFPNYTQSLTLIHTYTRIDTDTDTHREIHTHTYAHTHVNDSSTAYLSIWCVLLNDKVWVASGR